MSKFNEFRQMAYDAIETKEPNDVWKVYGAARYCYGEGLINGDEMFELAEILIVNHCSTLCLASEDE